MASLMALMDAMPRLVILILSQVSETLMSASHGLVLQMICRTVFSPVVLFVDNFFSVLALFWVTRETSKETWVPVKLKAH